MTPREWLQLSIPVLLLLGIAVSIWGTFLLTHWYHALRGTSILAAIGSLLWYTLTFRPGRARAIAVTSVLIGQLNPENKAASLIGIYWIFIGFVLQGVAVALSLGDTIWGIATRH